MEGKQRDNWSSRIGFIFAAAGSAVGLGNIWRFPYLAAENGGSAFIFIYLLFVLGIGLNVMIAEFAIGRRTQLAAVGAYKKLDKRFTFAGVIGVLSAFLIMGFYPVVGGWSVAYIVKSFTGLLSDQALIADAFGGFITSSYEPLLWMLLYMAINIYIVAKGVTSGIEKAGKILMPTLLVLFIFVAIRSVTLDGAFEGLKFLFKPDFSKVTGETFLAALGQQFFSLSLGMGCMITYGSYISKKEALPKNALIITLIDTSVAILASIAIIPALFAFGLEVNQGPGLVFIVVPQIFAGMGALGPIISAIFFIALAIAALTSSISLLEVVVAYLIDERKMKRKNAVAVTGLVMTVMSVLSSLSLGAFPSLKLFGVAVFDFFDIITDKIFLAIGGLLIALFVGWFMKKEDMKDELTNGGTLEFGLFNVWYTLIKYVVPVAIALVAIFGIIAIEQTSLMIFGLLVILVLAIFSKKL
ncbi:sodium-dependent transporter [Soehngenia longivitae]|uniref:Sodium-dependent transporter n=1 Tax=Soehngenia longivitae TaxID=2562294 RepID=A0A4Z0D795_9FIRM|nr:sodium-dependent transporter [Soehngenia longivitae]TFZ40754.1 sodium-dependent transporter [Soehngenia longivitae]